MKFNFVGDRFLDMSSKAEPTIEKRNQINCI